MMVRLPGRVSPLADLTAITNSSFPCWLVPVRINNECDSITDERGTIRNDDLTIGTIKEPHLWIHGNIFHHIIGCNGDEEKHHCFIVHVEVIS
jgi:hypothetical protein